MSLLRAGKRAGIGLKAIYAFLVALLFIVQATPSALAGTTGVLAGTVTTVSARDISKVSPLANVKVTAVAPTGRYSATTNNSGFFSIAGVFSDTYTVSFELQGYEPQSRPGVTVFADQTENLNITMAQSLKTIAKVAARSPGGAYQPNQTTDTYNITSTQINTINGSALNISESNLITSLPGGSFDSSGYPVIRGGRENEENFQFEGIPYTDAFTNQFTNSLAAPGLGLQTAQLTPGLGDASSENYGTGTFNLVAKRGTYPGFATAQLAVGAPNFRHSLNLEYGFASPDGRISNYMTLAANDNSRYYGDNNATDANSIGTFFSRKYQSSREFVDNLIYKFGKNNNQAAQFFIDMGDFHFFNGYGGTDQFCFRSCDPLQLPASLAVNGLRNTPFNRALIQGLVPLDPHQTSANETLGQEHRASSANYQPNIAYKFGYTWNINPTTFLQAMAYHTNAVVTFDLPLSGGYSTFGSSRIQLQGGMTTGYKLDLTKQLGDRHLVKLGGGTRYLHPVFDSVPYNYAAFLVTPAFTGAPNNMIADFIQPSQCAQAYAGRPIPANCGYLYNQGANSVPVGTKIPTAYENTSVGRNDYSAYIQDTWSPSDRLKINYGIRLDVANYQLPPARIDPFTCTSQYLPNYTRDAAGNIQFFPSTNPNAQTYDPNTGAAIGPMGSCPQATFALTDAAKKPSVPQPDFSVSYRLGANDSVRSSYGRSVEFAPLALVDNSADPGYYGGRYANIPADRGNPSAGNSGCGVLMDQQCTSFGQQLLWQDQYLWAGNPPQQPVRPVVFTNFDLSYSHQFTKGHLNGVAFKVTPYYRKAHDETAIISTPLVFNGVVQTDPNTGATLFNPPTANNSGVNQDTGVEMQITKEALYGLSGQLSLTYQNEFSSVIPVSSSEDFFPSIPSSSVALGNVYRVGFLSPFVASLDLSYRTRNGWRINPQVQYNVGYPQSPGGLSSAFINGKPYNIINTNASLGINSSPFGAPQYIDPMNPGSFFKPNIDATRGIDFRSSPGAILSHPSSQTNLVIEYTSSPKLTYGFQMFNVFNAIFGGASFNGRYQPVATGISGPLTGQTSLAFNPLVGPQFGVANFGTNRRGNQPFIDTPNGNRTYYFYTTIKL